MSTIVPGQRLTLPAGARLESMGPSVDRDAVRLAIDRWSAAYGVDPRLARALAWMESGFQEDVISSAGAVGVMQLLPETAQGIATRTGGHKFVVRDLLDPEINVRYGSWYLRNLLNRYDDDLPTALAAYHAGQGNVDAWRRRGLGIQFPETRSYVKEVLDAEEVYADAYAEELSGA